MVRVSRPPPQSGYLPRQSSVLADLLSCRDQVMGVAWSFHPLVATALLRTWRSPAWSFHPPVAIALLRTWRSPSLDLFVTGLPTVLPLCCSLVPNPWVVFLDAFRVHRGMGEWLESERPHSLQDSGLPPSDRGRSGSRPVPFPSRGFPGSLPSWQGVVSLASFGLSISP